MLVDEAYFDYVEEPSYGTLIGLALADPRVVVLRTLSKVHGMAGSGSGMRSGGPRPSRQWPRSACRWA